MEENLYFAYGSNLDLEQMAQRCPDAEIVGPVRLENYELRFRGSGFATVAPKKGSTVHGLVWKITPNCEQSLDRYEGYPRHYMKETVTVKDAAGAEIPVMVYIMAEPYCRQPALPSPYYYRVIQRGFEANGLPVESLQAAWDRTVDEAGSTSQNEHLSETEIRSGNSEQRWRLCKEEDHKNRDHKGQDPNEQENLFAKADFCRLADQRGRGDAYRRNQ